MKKVYCDGCGKLLPSNYRGEIYIYDWCGKEKCAEKLEKGYKQEVNNGFAWNEVKRCK